MYTQTITTQDHSKTTLGPLQDHSLDSHYANRIVRTQPRSSTVYHTFHTSLKTNEYPSLSNVAFLMLDRW